MKKLLTLFFCLATYLCSGQENNYFYLGGGLGLSESNAVVNSKMGYKVRMIGIEGSIISHTDNRNPALINGQMLISFEISTSRVMLLNGFSYHITTFDRVDGTAILPIFGLEWARITNYSKPVIYIRGQVSGKQRVLIIGMEGIFK